MGVMISKRMRRMVFLPTLMLFATTLLLSGLCLLGGCGQGQTRSDDGKPRLVYMMWGTTDEYYTVEKYIESFNEKFPDIVVDIMHCPGGYNDKLQTMIAAGTPPDVMYIGKDEFPAYVHRGALMNLSTLMEQETEFGEDDFFPVLVEQFKANGICYGIPKDYSPIVLYYNKDMFDKAGISYPTRDWTWNDLLKASKALTVKDEAGRPLEYGVIADLNWTFWAPWVWQNGGELMTRDLSKWLLADPQYIDANTDALSFYYDLIFKHEVAPKPSVTMDMGCADMFASGRVAMCTYGRWVCQNFKNIKNFAWDIEELPKGKQRGTTICTVAYSISSKCRYPQEAWELVKFLTGKEGQIAVAAGGQAVPSRIEVAESDFFLKSPLVSDDESVSRKINNRVYLDSTSYGRGLPASRFAAQVNDIVTMEFDLFFKTGRPARETLEEVQRGLQQYLEKQ